MGERAGDRLGERVSGRMNVSDLTGEVKAWMNGT